MSGDSGNGFRSMPMCWFHNTFFAKYGLCVEQLPLPPRHAHNVTDGLIARLNAFFGRVMRMTRLVGPRAFFDALQAGTSGQSLKKLVTHCTPIIRHFAAADFVKVPRLRESISLTIKNEKFNIGIMKLGYFKHLPEHPGVMLVRHHADPLRHDNPTLVFDLIIRAPGFELCEACSNQAVSCFSFLFLSVCYHDLILGGPNYRKCIWM